MPAPAPPPAGQGPYGYREGPPPPGAGFEGRHDGFPGRHAETPLTGETAAKVKAAALEKVPGGTVMRLEKNADGAGPYEAHVRKSDGTHVVVRRQGLQGDTVPPPPPGAPEA